MAPATRDSEQPRPQGCYGGFYTHDDIKRSRHAAARYITAIPEIEAPATRRRPRHELSCTGGPQVSTTSKMMMFTAITTVPGSENVLTETTALFPRVHPRPAARCPRRLAYVRAAAHRRSLEDKEPKLLHQHRNSEQQRQRSISWDKTEASPNATVKAGRVDGATAAATPDTT